MLERTRRAAAWFVVASGILGALITIISLAFFEPGETFPANRVVIFAFILFVGCSVMIHFYLWISMLCIMLLSKGHSFLGKAFWLLVVVFGTSYGAAAYYFVVYRRSSRVQVLRPSSPPRMADGPP